MEITLKDQDIDIIGLSETRLDSEITDNEVKIDGYNIFRRDRNRNGGGVAIYVKESLPPPVIKLKSDTLELISLEIKQNHAKPFLVVCWYRPPTDGVDDTAFENLRHVSIDLEKENKEIILFGDTNCDLKNKQNKNAKKLDMIYCEFQLEQLIKEYTRVAVTTNELNEQVVTKTLIDHFSSSCPKYIMHSDVLKIGMVDHYLVYGLPKNQCLAAKK